MEKELLKSRVEAHIKTWQKYISITLRTHPLSLVLRIWVFHSAYSHAYFQVADGRVMHCMIHPSDKQNTRRDSEKDEWTKFHNFIHFFPSLPRQCATAAIFFIMLINFIIFSAMLYLIFLQYICFLLLQLGKVVVCYINMHICIF